MRLTTLFNEFFESEKAGGLILLGCTFVSLIFANSYWQGDYMAFWENLLWGKSLSHWINDGLMSIFFLLIGLELEREVYIGELKKFQSAILPLAAAIGGMIFPVGVYLIFNLGTVEQSGMGIPMATDIAFALAILSLLGNRVPASLKVFLTALAVIDDLGAIVVIATMYSQGLIISNLLIAIGIFSLLLIFNYFKIYNLIPYLVGGIVMWYFMLHSGVHATIAGVLLAFAIPFGNGTKKSPSYLLQHWLHIPVAYFILPLFALANTAIIINIDLEEIVSKSYTLGIFLGLMLGKPLGVGLFSAIVVWLGLGSLPLDLKWKHIVGVGFLSGIGFTMSIFITLLAFDQSNIVNKAKFTVLIASFLAASIGFLWLNAVMRKRFFD
jgi:Na+:H+ antiporter, NhaA family